MSHLVKSVAMVNSSILQETAGLSALSAAGEPRPQKLRARTGPFPGMTRLVGSHRPQAGFVSRHGRERGGAEAAASTLPPATTRMHSLLGRRGTLTEQEAQQIEEFLSSHDFAHIGRHQREGRFFLLFDRPLGHRELLALWIGQD